MDGEAGSRDDLLKVVAKYPGCWARPTEGGSYIFLQLPALKVTLDQFVKLCRAQAAVTVTPGTEFGPQFTDSVRLNFSQDWRPGRNAAHLPDGPAVPRLNTAAT